MARTLRYTPLFAAVLFSFALFLQSTAEDDSTLETEEKLPFIQSEADKRSFERQMQSAIKSYMKAVETNCKRLMNKRYKFGKAIKLPEYRLNVQTRVFVAKKRNGTISLVNGWAHGFPNISLRGENTVTYEESSLVFLSDVNLWKHMEIVYDFNLLHNGLTYVGHVNMTLNDAHYLLKVAIDTTNGMDVQLLDFTQNCVREITLNVEGIEGDRKLMNSVLEAVSEVYKGPDFIEIETVMRTILEDSLRNVSIRQLLPKVDYLKSYPQPEMGEEVLKSCSIDEAEDQFLKVASDPLPWESVKEIPFIQNIGEMWAFQKQLNKSLNQLVKLLSVGTSKHLAERELLRAKLTDEKFLMKIKDKTSTTRHSPILLSNGWFSSAYRFVVLKVDDVEINERMVDFTAYVRLADPIEFTQDFESMFLRKNYEGDIKGRVEFVKYVLKFNLELEKSTLMLKGADLDCLGEISVEITGLQSEDDWYSEELKKNILENFMDTTLTQVHALISQSFHYVASTIPIMQHLPKWNYARNFLLDLGFRISENDEDQVETCSKERSDTGEERLYRFSKLIGEDGVFNEPYPDSSGRYYTHLSGRKEIDARYLSTLTQTRYFESELRMKMNEYVYRLLKSTQRIIRTQDLGMAKMPDFSRPSKTKRNVEIELWNCWIDGLMAVEGSGVDIMEYDQRKITLITSMPIYKNLQFGGDYIVTGPRRTKSEGNISVKLPSMVITFSIEIDYLRTKTSKVEYMKLDCLGGPSRVVNTSAVVKGTSVSSVTDTVEEHFRDEMVDHVFQILRRAFEDAILETELDEFLPKWDYKRDYISEIIMHLKQNRHQTTMDFCDSKDVIKPSLKTLYPDEETVNFSSFLPEIRTEGLRRSFERQIRALMANGVNSMWRNMLKDPLQRFKTPKFHSTGHLTNYKNAKGENSRVSVIFNVTDFEGFASGSELDEVEFAYGKEDTLIMLYNQTWENIKVFYNISCSDYENDDVRESGTGEARAQGLQYLLKARFFLNNSTFSVDEFFLHCLRNFSVSYYGFGPETDSLLESIKLNHVKSFPESILGEFKETLFILYGYAANELNTSLYTNDWTYNRELFDIAARKEETDEPEICDESSFQGGNRTVFTRGDIPFIGSEAEWWSFSRQTKEHVNRFKKELRKLAKEFIRDNALKRPRLPDLKRNISDLAREEKRMARCKLTHGDAENLIDVQYAKQTFLDYGKVLKITSTVAIEELRFSYDLEIVSAGEAAGARVQVITKPVTFRMVIALNLEAKWANLEEFEFDCMGRQDVTVVPINRKLLWLEQKLPEAFKEDFDALIMDDVKKIFHLAFAYGVKTADISRYVVDWNYSKKYTATAMDSESEREKGGLMICSEVVYPTMDEVPEPLPLTEISSKHS